MIAELPYAKDGRAALSFATGCLLAAVQERARDADTHIKSGLWVIAIVTAFYAIVQIACAVRGVAVLFGAPDGMHDTLVRQGAAPAMMASYEVARPIVVGCFLALGCVQLAIAWFLSRGQIRRFLMAWPIALLIAGIAVTIQLSVFWNLEGVPSELHAPLIQAVAMAGLLAWSHRQQRQSEREQG